MSSETNLDVTYKDGTVNVPHLGISLRTIMGAAAQNHDIARDGRLVKLTYKSVYIGTIQLADHHLKGKTDGPTIRYAAPSR